MVNLGVLLMLATALSVQLGGAVAATLIPQVGPMGTVALRITIATLIIAPIARHDCVATAAPTGSTSSSWDCAWAA